MAEDEGAVFEGQTDQRASFRDPETGSSFTVEGEITAEKIRSGLEESRKVNAVDPTATVLDKPLTRAERLASQEQAAKTAKFEEQLGVEVGPTSPAPSKPKVEAETDEAIRLAKEETHKTVDTEVNKVVKAERKRLMETEDISREEAHRRTVGLSKESQDRMRADYDMDALDPADHIGWETEIANATMKGLDKNAESLVGPMNKGYIPTAEEKAGMMLRMGEMEREADALFAQQAAMIKAGDTGSAAVVRGRWSDLLENLDKLSQAVRKANSNTARGLAILNSKIDKETFALEAVTRQVRVMSGKNPTQKQTDKIADLVQQLEDAEVKAAAKEVTYQEDLAEAVRKNAEQVVESTTAKSRIRIKAKGGRQKFEANRADILKQLRELGQATTLAQVANDDALGHLLGGP